MPKRTPISPREADLKRSFGSTIKLYRQRLAISQEELAWRAEMHRTYLADVERGARNLSLSSMARLVDAIGVPLSTFFATIESGQTAAKRTTAGKKQPAGRVRRK